MAQLSKKKQEIIQREVDILRIARRQLLEKGFHGLTMESIAEKMEYSKGTLYQHFGSKEDVMAVLSMELEDLRHELLRRASVFRGRTRERVLAMGVALDIIYRLHPDFWRLEELIASTAIRSKLKPDRLATMDAKNQRTFSIVLSVIRDAIANGDLQPPSGLSPEEVFLGLVSSVRGLYTTWAADWWDRSWVPDFVSTHQKVVNVVCDGFCWRPFSTEWDYAATLQRIWTEVFPDEYAKLQAAAVSTVFPPHP